MKRTSPEQKQDGDGGGKIKGRYGTAKGIDGYVAGPVVHPYSFEQARYDGPIKLRVACISLLMSTIGCIETEVVQN